MGTTDAETGGGLGCVEGTGVEVVEGAMDEVPGQAVADLALFFMGSFKPGASPRGEAFRRSPLRSDLLHASPRGLPDGRVSFCSNGQSPFAPTPTHENIAMSASVQKETRCGSKRRLGQSVYFPRTSGHRFAGGAGGSVTTQNGRPGWWMMPTVLRWVGDGPTAAREVHRVVGVAASAVVEREVKVEQRRGWDGLHDRLAILQGPVPLALR